MRHEWIPRELTFLDAHVPTLFVAFLLAAVVIWQLDKWLAALSLYELVWYPALLRVALFLSVFSLFGLMVY
jgi:protein AaeX